uniref:Uncharacterized protein n=1 Tax=Amphimedon queenslandica TaxID=400682 RepID=A0A1X7T6E9_AMPQE
MVGLSQWRAAIGLWHCRLSSSYGGTGSRGKPLDWMNDDWAAGAAAGICGLKFSWLVGCSCFLLLILLLSGDVELNPGPITVEQVCKLIEKSLRMHSDELEKALNYTKEAIAQIFAVSQSAPLTVSGIIDEFVTDLYSMQDVSQLMDRYKLFLDSNLFQGEACQDIHGQLAAEWFRIKHQLEEVSVDFPCKAVSSDTASKIQEQSRTVPGQHHLSISLQEKISQWEPTFPGSNIGLSVEKEHDALKKNLANICITLARNVDVISPLNDCLFSLECIPEAVHIAVQNTCLSPYDRANKLVSSLLSILKTHSNPGSIFLSFITSLKKVGLTVISDRLSNDHNVPLLIQFHSDIHEVSSKESKDLAVHDSQVSIKRAQNEVTVRISSEKIREILVESTSAKEIKTMCIYVEEYLGITGLYNIKSVHRLFNKIKPHYSFLNCHLVDEIAGIFLPGKCDVQIKLRNYMEKLNSFEKSSSLQHIIGIIKETIEPTHDSTEVVFKLDRTLGPLILATFKKVIYYIFSDNSRVLSHIRIEEGSIYIKYSAPIAQFELLIRKASSKIKFMHQIGIIEMRIGNHVILSFDESISFEKFLLDAAQSGSLMELQMELLLQLQINIDYRNEGGMTALMIACYNIHHQVVELLLKGGADVNIQDNNGWTALMIASTNGHFQIVELLLKSADVNIQNTDGVTVLMLVSQCGHYQVLELLLENGADDVNIQNNNGWTALMIASQNGHHQVVELLLKK